MSLWKRFTLIFKAKANKALDRAEDPNETLDYSYEKQLQLLADVRRGVADVATSRKRIELQITQQKAQADKLGDQARQALAAGREDLAREALSRQSVAEQQIASLDTQHANLEAEERKLQEASRQLQARVDAFRTQKETIKATYNAAKATTKISEAVAGISTEFGDVNLAIARAQDKTERMQARAGAVDELLASGALSDPLAQLTGGGDDIARQLNALSAGKSVEDKLAAMKAQLGTGAAPKAIEGGGAKPADTVVEGRIIDPQDR